MSDEAIPAFMIFPVGVWETIIDYLYDSRDIQNLFRAYPELAGEEWLKRKYPLWLFDQIIPYFPSLSEILSFRQVCQRWVHVVESYLDTDPRYRAYSEDATVRKQRQAFHLHHPREIKPCTPWEKRFYTSEELTSYITHLANHPPGRNPFVTRPKICLYDGGCGWELKSKTKYWTSAMEFLTMFGEHIWFLEMGMETVGPTKARQHRLLQILSLVVNLKYLEVAISDDNCVSGSNPFKPDEQFPPPELPQLETLKIFGTPGPFAHFMFQAYFSQIRTLLLRHSQWERGWEYSSYSFPNLTEFTVDYLELPGVDGVLADLEAPQLHRLNLKVKRHLGNEPFPGSEIIAWLKHFPVIHEFEFRVSGYSPVDDETCSTFRRDCIPSLKSFKMKGKYAGLFELSFLECFPSLEYFNLFEWNIENCPGIDIDGSYQLYEMDVWKRLPKLEKLSYQENNGSDIRNFTRAEYEIYFKYYK